MPMISKVPLGAWSLKTGLWTPNKYMRMSADEQHDANVKNGYSCACGYLPSRCLCVQNQPSAQGATS